MMQLVKSENFGAVTCDVWKDEKGEMWFTREQIGQALEYGTPRIAISNIHERNADRLDKFSAVVKLSTPSGIQETYIYNQKGLNEICRFSRQPKADAFMDWVWEVVESIRKHGLYATDELLNDPDLAIKAFTALKEERERRKELEQENKILTGTALEWANKDVLNAIIRAYGAKIGFEEAWRDFKKELLYNHGININLRVTNYMNQTGKKTKPKVLTLIHDEEMSKCVSTAVALCKNKNVDISDIIKKYKKSA